MRNIKLTIEYDGSQYSGWQIQRSQNFPVAGRKKRTIQEVIEKTLQRILQDKIRLIASGRTDAGVHALAQIANFKTKSNISLKNLQYALNGLLPEDITISKTGEKDLGFHSRFAAKSKVYRYLILNQRYPSALLRNRVYFYPYHLDFKLMRQESACLEGRHDFKSFCASGGKPKDTLRSIKRITIAKVSYPFKICRLIAIDIEADGFLYNMVRNIVGTLIHIGSGKSKPPALKKILEAKDRRKAGPTAPAKGLYLMEVKY